MSATEIIIYSLVGLFILGLIVNGYRKIKLINLQRERNHCDLTTQEGRERLRYLNDEINKLMNVDPTRD